MTYLCLESSTSATVLGEIESSLGRGGWHFRTGAKGLPVLDGGLKDQLRGLAVQGSWQAEYEIGSEHYLQSGGAASSVVVAFAIRNRKLNF